jgi:cytochrome c553
MSPLAATLSKEDMQELADYFAAQKPAGNGFKPDAARVAAGGNTQLDFKRGNSIFVFAL